MKRIAALLFVWALLAVPLAAAAVEANVTATKDANQYQPQVTNQTVSVEGGWTYEANLNVESITKWWAGLYGTITESIVLGTNSSVFYRWPVTTLTGYVYATTGATVDWNTANWDLNVTTADINAALGNWTPTNETFENTFKNQDANADYCSVANAYYVLTYDNAGNPVWPTCAYKDTTNNVIIFEAKISQGGTSFKGTTVDYQMLVPAPETGTGTFAYYIWKG